MTPEELKYFAKYIAKEFVKEVTMTVKSVTNLVRPKLWMVIFSAILIYQIAVRRVFEVMFTLVVIIFIWMWDYWEAGHWRGQMRKEFYDKLKKGGQKNETNQEPKKN